MTYSQKEDFIELVYAFLSVIGKSNQKGREKYADIWEDSYRGDPKTGDYKFFDILKGSREGKTQLRKDYDMIKRQLENLYNMKILKDYAQKELKNYLSALLKSLYKKDWTKLEDGGNINNFSYNIGGL